MLVYYNLERTVLAFTSSIDILLYYFLKSTHSDINLPFLEQVENGKNLAQQGFMSGVRPQLAKGPTKMLQDQTQAPVNFIPVYLACVCVLRFIR
jgi:hypothetical protein